MLNCLGFYIDQNGFVVPNGFFLDAFGNLVPYNIPVPIIPNQNVAMPPVQPLPNNDNNGVALVPPQEAQSITFTP